MSLKQIRVCDGCGKELIRTADAYHLHLKTDRFWNSVDMDWFEKNLEFCGVCAENIKTTLLRIAEKR